MQREVKKSIGQVIFGLPLLKGQTSEMGLNGLKRFRFPNRKAAAIDIKTSKIYLIRMFL
jgi:hypothetical protein